MSEVIPKLIDDETQKELSDAGEIINKCVVKYNQKLAECDEKYNAEVSRLHAKCQSVKKSADIVATNYLEARKCVDKEQRRVKLLMIVIFVGMVLQLYTNIDYSKLTYLLTTLYAVLYGAMNSSLAMFMNGLYVLKNLVLEGVKLAGALKLMAVSQVAVRSNAVSQFSKMVYVHLHILLNELFAFLNRSYHAFTQLDDDLYNQFNAIKTGLKYRVCEA